MPKTFLTVTAAALLAATGAVAQETASKAQGQEVALKEVAFTWTAVDLSTVPMGKGQAATVSESFNVISSTDGPLAGLAGRCLFGGVSDLATSGIRDTGTCVYQDAEDNQLWERVQGASEGNGAPYAGTGTWIGGTGRFEGASGEHTFETTFAASPRAGVYQGTGMKQGTLILPGS